MIKGDAQMMGAAGAEPKGIEVHKTVWLPRGNVLLGTDSDGNRFATFPPLEDGCDVLVKDVTQYWILENERATVVAWLEEGRTWAWVGEGASIPGVAIDHQAIELQRMRERLDYYTQWHLDCMPHVERATKLLDRLGVPKEQQGRYYVDLLTELLEKQIAMTDELTAQLAVLKAKQECQHCVEESARDSERRFSVALRDCIGHEAYDSLIAFAIESERRRDLLAQASKLHAAVDFTDGRLGRAR